MAENYLPPLKKSQDKLRVTLNLELIQKLEKYIQFAIEKRGNTEEARASSDESTIVAVALIMLFERKEFKKWVPSPESIARMATRAKDKVSRSLVESAAK